MRLLALPVVLFSILFGVFASMTLLGGDSRALGSGRAGTVKAFLSAIQAAAPAVQAAPAALPASGDAMDTDAPAASAADGGSKEA